jgi:phospholipid N-methyltransferase
MIDLNAANEARITFKKPFSALKYITFNGAKVDNPDYTIEGNSIVIKNLPPDDKTEIAVYYVYKT